MNRLYKILIALTLCSLLVLAFTFQPFNPRCQQVAGKLVNGDPGYMTGALAGTYYVDFENLWWFDKAPPPERETSVYTVGLPSWVETPRGTLFFDEYSLLDTAEQQGLNGVVLSLVTGGTGFWEGASGLLTLTGYYHADASEGEWSYRGEICLP